MSRPVPSLTARWPNGRKVAPGLDARDFLTKEAERLGEDPEAVRRAIIKETPLARMLLAQLGLTCEALAGVGRPKDTSRSILILAVLKDLGEEPYSLPLAEAFKAAPRYLADPKLRKKTGVGSACAGVAHGKGRHKPLLSAEAVAAAYRTSQADVSRLFFDNIVDDPEQPNTAG